MDYLSLIRLKKKRSSVEEERSTIVVSTTHTLYTTRSHHRKAGFKANKTKVMLINTSFTERRRQLVIFRFKNPWPVFILQIWLTIKREDKGEKETTRHARESEHACLLSHTAAQSHIL